MGCGAGLIPSLGLPCNGGSKDVLVPAVKLKVGRLPFCLGRFKSLRATTLKKVPPPLVGDLGEKFWLRADVVLGQGCWDGSCACVTRGSGGEILRI